MGTSNKPGASDRSVVPTSVEGPYLDLPGPTTVDTWPPASTAFENSPQLLNGCVDSTLAWSVGVAIPVLGLSIIPNGWPLAIHVVVAIAAAVAMGATVGAITARPLVTLVPTDAPLPQPTLATTEEPQQ